MLPLLCSVMLLAGPSGGEVLEMGVQNGLWHVSASQAPLVSILERLSRETGMRMVYLGAPPSGTVTVRMEGATVAEILDRILARQARVELTDWTGDGVELLILVNEEADPGARKPPEGGRQPVLRVAEAGTGEPGAMIAGSQSPAAAELAPAPIDPSPAIENRDQSSASAASAAPSAALLPSSPSPTGGGPAIAAGTVGANQGVAPAPGHGNTPPELRSRPRS